MDDVTLIHDAACTPEERAMFYAEFLTLNQRIDQFLETASPVLAYDNNSSRRFPLIIVHSLANLATIRLNVSSTWTTKSINAACAVVHLLDDFNLREIRFIHPMISVRLEQPYNHTELTRLQKVWGIVGQVLIDEITRLRILDIATTTPDDRASEARLTNTLERLLKIVATFADGCSSMSACLPYLAAPIIHGSIYRHPFRDVGQQTQSVTRQE